MVSRPHVPIALMVVTTMLLLTVVPTSLSGAGNKGKGKGPPEKTFSLTLTWDANTEEDLAGYKVYVSSTSGDYGEPRAIVYPKKKKRRTLTPTYEVTEIQINTTYFFVVTAFDTVGNESAHSNEVSAIYY